MSKQNCKSYFFDIINETDKMCVYYNKPLLVSETVGTKAYYQITFPKITDNYHLDHPPKCFPSTIHNLPSTIEECCVWTKAKFNELFEKSPQLVRNILSDKNYIENTEKNDYNLFLFALKATQKYLITEKCNDFNDCIKWARLKFEEFFNFKIRNYIALYPEDLITSDGLPFWTGKRRFPTPATFDPNNCYHAQFVKSAALIRARVCGIKTEEEVDILQIASKVEVPTSMITDEYSLTFDHEQLIRELTPFIEKSRQNLPTPESLDKDDDSKGHIDFISSGTIIRAISYFLFEPKDELEIKRIARNIIPAIATTTAMICGLVALEMYKVHCVDKDKKNDDFRFGVINLAIPTFLISEPMPCEYIECSANKIKFSLWDNWTIEGDLTVDQFIKEVKNKYRINVIKISCGMLILYSNTNKNNEKRLNEKITDILVNDLGQPPLTDEQRYLALDCTCVDDDDNIVEEEIPTFRLKIK